MKIRKIKIQIKSLDEALNEFVSTGHRLEKGPKAHRKKATYIADAETARSIFTESRLRIIHVVKHEAPSSIYEVAKILKRDFKNVYEDVLFLAEVGILGLTENKQGRKQKKPSLLCENILFQIAA